jgi:hypothetical protein
MTSRRTSVIGSTVPAADGLESKSSTKKTSRNDDAVCNKTGILTLIFVAAVTIFVVHITPPPSGHPRIENPVPDVLFTAEQMEDHSEGQLDHELLRKIMPPELNVITKGHPSETKKIAWAVTVSKGKASLLQI